MDDALDSFRDQPHLIFAPFWCEADEEFYLATWANRVHSHKGGAGIVFNLASDAIAEAA